MSESLETVEITDTSISLDALCELKDISEVAATPSLEMEMETKTKRQLSDTELDPLANDPKRTRMEEVGKDDVEEDASVIDETIVTDTNKTDANCTIEINDSNILEQNIILDKSDDMDVDADTMLEELPSQEIVEDHEDEEAEENEEEGEEEEETSFDYPESESDHSSEEEDDDVMMARAMKATETRNQIHPKPYQVENEEPIALDDSEDETPRHRSDSEQSSEYSVDNRVIGESSDDEHEQSLLPQKPAKVPIELVRSRRLVQKSIRILTAVKRLRVKKKKNKRQPTLADNGKPTCDSSIVEGKLPVAEASIPETKAIINEEKEVEPMEITEQAAPLQGLPLQEASPESQPNQDKVVEMAEQMSDAKTVENNEKATSPPQVEKAEERQQEQHEELVQEKRSTENSNESSRHDSSLLNEISNSTIEEIFNRYVIKNTDQSPTLDEFSEELFYCLQQNKQEIEKAQHLWNEKLHVKYKIRELMETIRRRRAVMEIEAFGYKPDNAGNNSHPIISSKSSTTTNSEADHHEKHFRMSSDSVNRLIQDVRASMLKRDDKQRAEDSVTAANAIEGAFESNSLASQWNSLQSGGPQGRQGQIIDVQSIINDFRQKNPQEIPRRGRRMKNSFGSGYFDNQSMDEGRSIRNEYAANVTNNSQDFNSTKSNAGGYPEVSLHPVHNLYKNLSNASGTSGVAHFSGQKSSLLQSILTKQSTKSPVGFHPNHSSLPSTSTLARLLTAPERTFQGTPKHTNQASPRQTTTKVHNNGEITITPIGLNNARNKDYAMDDEENSMEPPLVIDETEDFDTSERSNLKSVSDLLCQGCKKSKAFFMCAGCSRQWYCSKECQEMAWDEHAESCMI